jgi:hypothetical protein
MPQKIKRQDARRQGLKRYFTGVPCKHNHVSERNVGTAQCLACCRRKDSLRRARTDPAFKTAKNREKHLKTRYGITLDDYVALVEKQEGRCACCNNLEKNLLVDHDHDSDKVRGLLCINCNSMLGYALDNPRRLELGIEYLNK